MILKNSFLLSIWKFTMPGKANAFRENNTTMLNFIYIRKGYDYVAGR